ncbi:MAG: hypothetical protein IME99_00655 [Proteobacteria bacterium]|nr:hypothetical protein [Pseudomonadota bacterium]
MRPRSAVKVLLLALLLFAVPVSYGAAEESVVVIVNSSNSIESVSTSYIKKLYKNRLLKWPSGVPVTLYDLAEEDPVREVFSKAVLGKPSYRVAERWAHLKITNQAKNPPFTMKSQSLIIRRVSREKGAIGYVLRGSVKDNSSVRIVSTIR